METLPGPFYLKTPKSTSFPEVGRAKQTVMAKLAGL